jgi:hypothetical protein
VIRLACFAFAFGTLGCLFLISPVYAIAQDLPEAQRLERCENNRKTLADYDRQLEAVDAKLRLTMTDEEFALAKAHRVFVFNIQDNGFNKNPAVREEQVAKLEELSILYEFDGREHCPTGFKDPTTACLIWLGHRITERVSTAVQSNSQKDELKKQRAQLQRQRAVHQSRLKELGCDSQKNDCQGFAGAWKTTFGTMTFERSGNQITASYDFDGGNIRGTLSGSGRTLRGTYTETEAKGTFLFTLTADGKSFSGNWNRTSGTREPPSGEWSGECTSP